ncbi:MAG TPA: uroporphyrinogen-III C-methyltransferase [Gammaproteobacteria bacterium]|nr:uroporphyrinogen-III C-methyltransferase [Gammaproteobacteria bacterium]
MSAAPDGRERPPARSGLLVSLGFVLAAAALLLAGLSWYRLRQSQDQLAALQQQFAALQQSAATRDEVASDASDTQSTVKALIARQDALSDSLTELRAHSQAGRDAWIRAEAASLLMDANEEIALEADPARAQQALQQADARLKLLPDPRLIPVRQEIIRESDALSALPRADRQGMAVALTELAAGVDGLPLRRSAPTRYQPGGELGRPARSDTGFWERFKAGFSRLTGALFTVRRHDQPVEPLLPPDQAFLLRRNLELKLETSRSALMERQGEVFQASAAAAEAWLKEFFDTSDNAVKSAIQQLDEMQKQQIAPKLPDISRSLLMLRQLEPPKATAP